MSADIDDASMQRRDFAKILRASDGRQVILFVEPDGGDYKLNVAAHFTGGMAMTSLCFQFPDEENNEATAFNALDGYCVEHADQFVVELKKMLGDDE